MFREKKSMEIRGEKGVFHFILISTLPLGLVFFACILMHFIFSLVACPQFSLPLQLPSFVRRPRHLIVFYRAIFPFDFCFVFFFFSRCVCLCMSVCVCLSLHTDIAFHSERQTVHAPFAPGKHNLSFDCLMIMQCNKPSSPSA